MADLAKHIEVVHEHGKRWLLIDGEEFPWLCSAETAVSTTVSGDKVPSVTVEIQAEQVTVRDNPFAPVTDPNRIRDFFAGIPDWLRFG